MAQAQKVLLRVPPIRSKPLQSRPRRHLALDVLNYLFAYWFHRLRDGLFIIYPRYHSSCCGDIKYL